MRWFSALLFCSLTVTLPQAVLAQGKKVAAASSVVQGVLTEVTKAEDTPTGTITVVDDSAKATKFTVTEFTQFVIVKGTEHHRTNFLKEHRGEYVIVKALADSNPLTAAKVEIILPPPPPPPPPVHITISPPKPGHVRGHVVDLTPTTVTIRVDHTDPPPPVAGVISDVAVDQDKELGSIKVKVNGTDEKFVVTAATRFYKIKGYDFERLTFLSAERGQTVVMFPRIGHKHVADKVDIMLIPAQAAKYAQYHPKHRLVTFLLTSSTAYIKVRDGHHEPTTPAALTLGEHVAIMPTGIHSHIAQHVDILLPHAVHGTLTAVTPTVVKVKVRHSNAKHPAHNTEVAIALAPSTVLQTVDKKVYQSATLAALHPGERVVVFPAAPPPHAAERLEIHLAPNNPVTVHGKVVSNGNGALVVKVKDAQQTFQLNPNTKVELIKGKDREAATVAALAVGRDVIIHAHVRAGSPGTADRIEVKPAPAPKKKAPPKNDKK